MKPKFKLGDKVVVQAIREKQKLYANGATETKFETKSVENVMGIYIGYRTAAIGFTYYSSEDGPEFHHKGSITYYLVVINPRQNPIKAHPDFTL